MDDYAEELAAVHLEFLLGNFEEIDKLVVPLFGFEEEAAEMGAA